MPMTTPSEDDVDVARPRPNTLIRDIARYVIPAGVGVNRHPNVQFRSTCSRSFGGDDSVPSYDDRCPRMALGLLHKSVASRELEA